MMGDNKGFKWYWCDISTKFGKSGFLGMQIRQKFRNWIFLIFELKIKNPIQIKMIMWVDLEANHILKNLMSELCGLGLKNLHLKMYHKNKWKNGLLG